MPLTEDEVKILKGVHFWALSRAPGSRLIQSDTWLQVVSEMDKTRAHNEIIYSYEDDPNFEKRLDDIITFYRDLGTDFKWCTNPFTQPANIKELLKSRGFTSWNTTHMYLRLSDADFARPHAGDIRFVRRDEMESFIDLYMECWNIDPVQASRRRDQLLFDHEQAHTTYERYVGYVDGKPAGIGCITIGPEAAYFHSTAVLPEYQGRGLYRKLVEARLFRLRELNIKLAATVALPTSAPRLKHLGFETAWTAEIFLKTLH